MHWWVHTVISPCRQSKLVLVQDKPCAGTSYIWHALPSIKFYHRLINTLKNHIYFQVLFLVEEESARQALKGKYYLELNLMDTLKVFRQPNEVLLVWSVINASIL